MQWLYQDTLSDIQHKNPLRLIAILTVILGGWSWYSLGALKSIKKRAILKDFIDYYSLNGYSSSNFLRVNFLLVKFKNLFNFLIANLVIFTGIIE